MTAHLFEWIGGDGHTRREWHTLSYASLEEEARQWWWAGNTAEPGIVLIDGIEYTVPALDPEGGPAWCAARCRDCGGTAEETPMLAGAYRDSDRFACAGRCGRTLLYSMAARRVCQ